MNRPVLLVLALLAAACGAPAMDGPAVDPGPTPDMGTDSAPAVPPVPTPVVPPPVTPGKDAGGADVAPGTPDAAPRPEAAPPVGSDAGGAREASSPVPSADGGKVDPWGPPYSEDFCINTLHLDGCKSLNAIDSEVRATNWIEGQCSIAYKPAVGGCGRIQEPGYVLDVKLICHAGIWRATLGSCSCDPGYVRMTCAG